MKKSFSRKISVIWLIIFTFVFCATSTQAQKKFSSKKPNNAWKNQNPARKSKRKKSAPKVYWAGVINGRAIDLVKPEYPKSAEAVNVYGIVSVLVLIDEKGNIAKANAANGHPLLCSASIKAALSSKFEPVTSGGIPIRVQGIIVYNFIPEQWNWLEIGYTLGYDSNYYTINTLSKTLPFDYETERQLLKQRIEATENLIPTTETIIALIRGKISNQTKSSWLFEVGLALAEIRRRIYARENTLNRYSENYQNLIMLTQNPPPHINETLMERMQKVIFLIEEGDTKHTFEILQNLEKHFPYVGK